MFIGIGQIWYLFGAIAVIELITLFLIIFHGRRMFLNIRMIKADEQVPATNMPYPEDWACLATGESGHIEFEYSWLRKFQELYRIFCEKQSDYGPTNIGVGGLPGVTTRIGDKTSRLYELTGVNSGEGERKEKVKGESVRDAFMDLADYGIIGVMVYDNDWPLVKPSDVWGSSRKTARPAK